MWTLYRRGQARVHIDQVHGWGEFLELEIVLRPEQSEIEGKNIIEALLSDFGIDKQQLIGEAYIDLLARPAGPSATIVNASRLQAAQ